MKAIIIDDEPSACVNLKALITRFCPEVILSGEAHNIEEAEALIHRENPDLVFLDIQMPNGSGFQLLDKLQSLSFHVIFTTSYHEYAVKAIRVSALDYLLKPIDTNELRAAVQRSMESQAVKVKDQYQRLHENLYGNRSNQIAVKTPTGQQMLLVDELVCCEADGRYVYFHTLDRKKILVSQNMKQYQGMLEGFGFIRVHHSFMLNSKLIREYNSKSSLGRGGAVIASNGMQVPISLRRKKVLLDFLDGFSLRHAAQS